MALSVRERPYELPSYSLTSDLLGFLRCGLQYRYSRIGRLPPSRPVQLWFGQYIHGVMEEAFLRYAESRKQGGPVGPPYPASEIKDISDLINRRLAAQGLVPWKEEDAELGLRRAEAAINDLGPDLFPLIHQAEVRLTGARPLDLARIPATYRVREADRYEMIGIVDVITNVELQRRDLQSNRLLQAIVGQLGGGLPPKFELIIDYKGMRRPPTAGGGRGKLDLWAAYGWQVQTYAHLRRQQPDSLPVAAGIIIYMNELAPTASDLRDMRRESRRQETDVPLTGEAERLVKAWRQPDPLPLLPYEFRLSRALRVIPVTTNSLSEALQQFDRTVAAIETSRGKEHHTGKIQSSWEQRVDESTCTACDARTFCPSYTVESKPVLPGVRVRR